MKPKIMIASAVLFLAGAGAYAGLGGRNFQADIAQEVQATVFYDPTCGCCGNHIAYLERSGFQVERKRVQDMSAVKREYGIPEELVSCHTSVIDGYAVEGHMPLDAIAKLLEERPEIKGIALPGMPQGSPGMGGSQEEPWIVYAIEDGGTPRVFMEL